MTAKRTAGNIPDSLKLRHSIVYVRIDQLRPNPGNSRAHRKSQIRKLAHSIKAHSFISPVLIDPDNNVVAGHGRIEAANYLNMVEVPTIRVGHLNAAQIQALALADNRLHDESNWNDGLLAIQLKQLSDLGIDFDIETTGFDLGEIDVRIEGLEIKSVDQDERDDRLPPETRQDAVSRTGDLWVLGRHRVICGNALDSAAFSRLMDAELATAIITDPPFNVKIDGHVSGLGADQHREFAMASGEMTSGAFQEFLTNATGLLARHSLDGSLHFIFMDWRHLPEALAACGSSYAAFKNLCVWSKHNAGMGSFYRSQHELVLVFKHGRGRHRNNIELGRYGRHRSNVWSYPSANNFGRNNGEDSKLLKLHPTVKPVAMLADAIMDCTARGDLVLDSFLGSGSTLVAAEKVGRRCCGLEIDPLYVDLIIRRWQSFGGAEARHAETGRTFDELAAERGVHHG
jgi:DNA modification methylase